MVASDARRWSGTTLADRQEVRRQQLLEAGLDLLGDPGGAVLSVRAVCRRSKLTERYFYENFVDREAFVLAVYEHISAQAHQALAEAVVVVSSDPTTVAEAAVGAFVELILDDPRKGHALLLAPLADPALLHRGVELLPAFATLIRDQLPSDLEDHDRDMTAIGLVGGLAQLFVAYLTKALIVSRDQLVRHCVGLLVHAAATVDTHIPPPGQDNAPSQDGANPA